MTARRAGTGRPVLAMVESNTTGTGRAFATAARARGLRPVLLSLRPERYPWVAEDGVDVARADTTDATSVAAVARFAGDGAPLAGLVTSSEYFVAVTARAAARRGLPGPDPAAVERCRDKRRQRVALEAAGVPVPVFASARSGPEAVAVAEAIGFPVVVKPVDGTGSRGVRLCGDRAQVAGHASELLARRHDERGQPTLPLILVEEYVAGPEFSVETMGRAVIGITAKHLGPPPSFVETGHDFPAGAGAAPPAVADVARAALEAIGLGFGPAHTEIRIGPSGPVVIEVNPRLAGGRIPVLVRLATGVDLVGAAVDAAVGADRPLPRPGPGHASIRFLVAERAGRVRHAGGILAAAAVPGVIDVGVTVRPGQRVGGTGSFLDRVGHVISAAPRAADARSAAEAALACLELEVEADGAGPVRRPVTTAVG